MGGVEHTTLKCNIFQMFLDLKVKVSLESRKR